MDKQLVLHFDTGDRDFRDFLIESIDGLYRSSRKKMDRGNFSSARKEFLKMVHIVSGMNPVRPFVRDFIRRSDHGRSIAADHVFLKYQMRVSRGEEIPVKKNVFGAYLRRALDEEFGVGSAGVSNKVYEGFELDVR